MVDRWTKHYHSFVVQPAFVCSSWNHPQCKFFIACKELFCSNFLVPPLTGNKMPSSPQAPLTVGSKPPTRGFKLQNLYLLVLPDSTKPLCCSIASFTRTLLLMNLKIPSDKWMNVPSSTTLDSVAKMPDSILLHEINPIPTSALTKITKKIPPVYQLLFLEDLEKSRFPGWTFAWDQPWECQWNQFLVKFIIKHWQNSNCAGALKAFYMERTESCNNILQLGVLHRWFVGQKDGVCLGHFSSARRTAKKKSEEQSKFQLQVGCHPFVSYCMV